KLLQKENNYLKSVLLNNTINDTVSKIKYAITDSAFQITPAIVIKNSYALNNNILLLNKGKKDSIEQDFGVITSEGVLGIIDQTSNRFATVISVLNTKNKISAQLKKTKHFGTLQWNGTSPEYVQLIDIPSKVKLQQGDTITTSGRSAIFPKGIPIGSIENFHLDTAENFYEIEVKLFTDMTNVEHVYIIKNKHATEINNLLNNNNE
ncbi:MAG: rod shape-determining protein MreC, partial [Oceanihabitans sp.]